MLLGLDRHITSRLTGHKVKLPRIRGIIRRRLLVNFRVDPEVMSRNIPAPFQPKLHNGYAIAGICLIRLEQIRPSLVPFPFGLHSENAAHRIAVCCPNSEEAVFSPRRDSDSWLNHMAGGLLFPGEHHQARFDVVDDERSVDLKMESLDCSVSVRVSGATATQMPLDSVFASLDDASRFFEAGSLGYSTTRNQERFDAIILQTSDWRVEPFAVSIVSSSYFENAQHFPPGTVTFDHALIMRNVRHQWLSGQDLYAQASKHAV